MGKAPIGAARRKAAHPRTRRAAPTLSRRAVRTPTRRPVRTPIPRAGMRSLRARLPRPAVSSAGAAVSPELATGPLPSRTTAERAAVEHAVVDRCRHRGAGRHRAGGDPGAQPRQRTQVPQGKPLDDGRADVAAERFRQQTATDCTPNVSGGDKPVGAPRSTPASCRSRPPRRPAGRCSRTTRTRTSSARWASRKRCPAPTSG